MKERLIEKVNILQEKLALRKNNSSDFFKKISKELNYTLTEKEAIDKLRFCYVVTQYANFSYEEEKMLDEIWEIIKDK